MGQGGGRKGAKAGGGGKGRGAVSSDDTVCVNKTQDLSGENTATIATQG